MQSYEAREEREIDLIDIIWRLLMQWKPIVLAMIVCAAAVAGGMYVRDIRGYRAAVAAQDAMSEEDMMAELTEEEYNAVVLLYDSKIQRDEVRKYADESLLLQANPYDRQTLSISYRVDTANETSNAVTSMYATLLGEDEFAEKVADAIGYDGDIKYVRELYSVSVPGIESSSLMFSFNMTLLTDMDADVLSKVVDDYVLQEAYQRISASAPFTVTKMTQSVKDIMVTGDTTSRIDIETRIKNLDTAMDTTLDGFSDGQKALYAKMTGQNEEDERSGSVFKATEDDESLLAKPQLSFKYLLVGAFVGAFLYAGCVMLFAIFSPTTQTTTDMCDIYGLYQINELHNRKFNGSLKKFLYDKNIYALRYRKKNKDADVSAAEATTQIVGLKEHDAVGTVYLAPLGKGFSKGAAADYYEALKKKLAEKAVATERLHEESIKDEVLSVPKDAGIVVLTNVGDTTYRSLDEVCGYARKYDLAVLGVVALEVN